jgi:hypothetical protein
LNDRKSPPFFSKQGGSLKNAYVVQCLFHFAAFKKGAAERSADRDVMIVTIFVSKPQELFVPFLG